MTRVLEDLRQVDDDQLLVQLSVFEDSQEEDLEQLYGPEGQLGLNHYDAFNALFSKVRDTPHALQLLALIHNLTKLDPDDKDRYVRHSFYKNCLVKFYRCL